VPELQHPAHEVPPQLQAPPLHDCPPAHIPQTFPADPQALPDWFAVSRQVSPWQHPFGQEPDVHVHVPEPTQAWLAPHAPHAAPPAPHFVASSMA
jgi:hypothetical protein